MSNNYQHQFSKYYQNLKAKNPSRIWNKAALQAARVKFAKLYSSQNQKKSAKTPKKIIQGGGSESNLGIFHNFVYIDLKKKASLSTMEKIRESLLGKARDLEKWEQDESAGFESMYKQLGKPDPYPYLTGDLLLFTQGRFGPNGKKLKTNAKDVFGHIAVGEHAHALLVYTRGSKMGTNQKHYVFVGNLLDAIHCVSTTCDRVQLKVGGVDYDVGYIDQTIFPFRVIKSVTQFQDHKTKELFKMHGVRLKSNQWMNAEEVTKIRFSVAVLGEYLIKLGISYGGVGHIVTKQCFFTDRTGTEVKKLIERRWQKLLTNNRVTQLVCSSLVLYLYQLVIYLLKPDILHLCLNMDAKACKPNAIAALPKHYPDFWESIPETLAYDINQYEIAEMVDNQSNV